MYRIKKHFWKFIWIIPVCVFTIFVFFGSRAHPLWYDEAETAIFAKNILTYGVPKGWDGVNIIGFNDATVLGRDLINHVSPWPQYYLSAFSFALFGVSSFTARLPSIVISIVSIIVFYFLTIRLTGRKEVALLSLAVASISVEIILFSYQARYYSAMMLLGLLLTWVALDLLQKTYWPKILFVLLGICFIYSHYISFLLFYVALAFAMTVRMICARRGRVFIVKYLLTYGLLGVLIGATFAPWILSSEPMFTSVRYTAGFRWFTFDWYFTLREILFMFNATNMLPYGFIVIIAIELLVKIIRRKNISVELFLLALIVGYIGISIASDTITLSYTRFISFRYQIPLFLFVIMTIAFVLDEIRRANKFVFIIVFILIACTNIFTFDPPMPMQIMYIYEIMHPYETPDHAVAEYLRVHAKDGDTAFTNLDRDIEPLMFFLGNKIRFVNRVSLSNPTLFPKNISVLPRYIYDYIKTPDWVILYSKRPYDFGYLMSEHNEIPPNIDLEHDYEETILPIFFSDFSRPELFWHTFTHITPSYTDQVFIYHKKYDTLTQE